MFGPNFYNTMQGANVGFAPNLSDEEKLKALDDFSNMRGMYNPLDEYVKGWALLPPVIAGVVFTGPVESLAASEEGSLTLGKMALGSLSSCGAVVTTDYVVDNEVPDKAELALCGLGGSLGAGKTVMQKIILKMGLSFLSKGGI
ncbi:hypothetical protein AHV17_004590 [Salmonella enterica subsp. enterica serovar Texas]|nr:hypothetical protein [Salmonella enterica subsp. enterica serovar Texas]